MASLKEKRAALVKQLEEKQGLLAAGKADGDTIAFVKSALAEVEGIDRQLDGMKQSDDLLAQIGQLNAKSGVQHVGAPTPSTPRVSVIITSSPCRMLALT